MFDWDEFNIAHIAEHDVLPNEAEEAYAAILSISTTQSKTANCDIEKSEKHCPAEYLSSSAR